MILLISLFLGLAADLPLSLAQPAAPGTESPALSAFLQNSSKRGVSPEFVKQVLKNAQDMKRRGLPIEPYLLKANEGIAKGIPPERISPALRSTEQQVEEADRIIGRAIRRGAVVKSPGERQQATLKVQQAMLSGVPVNSLEKISDRIKSRPPGSFQLMELGQEAADLAKSGGPARDSKNPWKAWRQNLSSEGKTIRLKAEGKAKAFKAKTSKEISKESAPPRPPAGLKKAKDNKDRNPSNHGRPGGSSGQSKGGSEKGKGKGK